MSSGGAPTPVTHLHDDENFHTYILKCEKHDGIWGWAIYDVYGWGIYGLNGWGI